MSWRQIYLVLSREYLTRVKSKGFLAATFLVPLGIILLYGVGFAIFLWDTEVQVEIGIKDDTMELVHLLREVNETRYIDYSEITVDSLRSLVQTGELTGYVHITEENVTDNKPLELIYSGSGGMALLTSIRTDMRDVFRQERLKRAEVSEEIQNIFETRIGLESRVLTEEGEETDDDAAFLSVLGLIMGVIIFGAIFGYGGYIMRGVIEEKTNRIVEVITSSVRPIELLTGKLLGVGALAITQIGIWVLTLAGLSILAAPIAASFMSSQSEQLATIEEAQAEMPAIFTIPSIETSLIVYFVIFFILGYLLYSSLFAAIGSAADSETDTQQLILPIMVPIFIAYFILLQMMNNPDSMISVIGSHVPFFAPIVMISRIAMTDVAFWEIWLSIILMIAAFAATMWLSAKIYKVGILSYGSSAGFKDLAKWLRQ